jgi:porin
MTKAAAALRPPAVSDRECPRSMHATRRFTSLALSGIMLIASTATGQDSPPDRGLLPIPDYSGDFSSRQRLLGDWNDHRSALAASGLTLDWTVTQFGANSVDGGRDTGWSYGGKSEALLTLDLDRIAVVRGALVTLRLESRFGDSANTKAGTLLPVNDQMFFPQPPDEDFALRVTEFRYTQFLSKRAGFFIGKFTTLGGDLNEFSGGRGDTQFMSFNGHSTGALFGPYSTLGTGLFYNPSASLALGTSLVASTDSTTGTGLDTLDDGLIWSTTVGYQHRWGDLPGGMRATFQYAFDQDFFNFSDGPYLTPDGVRLPFERDTWAFVVNGWQYVQVEGEPGATVNLANGRQDLQGLGVWFRGGFADRDTNPVVWGLSVGIGGRGSLPGRDNDTWGLGYAYAEIREVAFVTDRLIESEAKRFESYYDAELTPWLHVSAHLNIAQPLLSEFDTASIISLRVRTAF